MNDPIDPSVPLLLAADVGGTHARVALVRAPTDADAALQTVAYRKLDCASYPNLAALLQTFLDTTAAASVQRCVVAAAGTLVGDGIISNNLVWEIAPSRLRDRLELQEVALLNDFEALGYAFAEIRQAGGTLLCGPDTRLHGPAVIVGPGTGLGTVVCLPEPNGVRVVNTEAGQMAFAPGSPREREVLGRLARGGGYVAYERILSGPGLLELYATLCELDGMASSLATPEAVTAAARECRDARAIEAVEMFCAVLGSFAGDLALAFMASGGVYLAGGILPEICGLVRQSEFARRVVDKGSMREFVSHVPVRLIDHGRYGVLGAARWYFSRQRIPEPMREKRAAEPVFTTPGRTRVKRITRVLAGR